MPTSPPSPPPSASSRPLYTPTQIAQFYTRISLPSQHQHAPGAHSTSLATSAEHGLSYLSALQRHTLASIPFENLDLHYSPHHSISIDAQHLFEKIVSRNDGQGGRGGYCMENNTLFYTVLKTLGFDIVPIGARVSEVVSSSTASTTTTEDGAGEPNGKVKTQVRRYTGWSHMINLVTIQGTKYFVDVGFGSGGPARPVPLVHDRPMLNTAPEQSVRLMYERIPDGTAGDQKMWVYEKRNSEQEDFAPCYCFAETEFLPRDFEVMSHYTSTARTSWFTYQIVCVKWLLSEDGEEIVGETVLMENNVKRRLNAKSEQLMEFKTEEDRLLALEEYLGIRLSQEERNGIKGMVSAIK